MSRTTVETITCDCCRRKSKTIVDGKPPAFDKDNVFHYDVFNPTNPNEKVDLCHDCFVKLRNLWTSFMIADGF